MHALCCSRAAGEQHRRGVVQKREIKVKEYEVERHALFFTDKDSRRIYKENVKFTLTRKNSVNGRLYKDDPTIMAWGLLNEPRCETWKVRAAPTIPLSALFSLHRSHREAQLLAAHSCLFAAPRQGPAGCRIHGGGVGPRATCSALHLHMQVAECPANYRAWVEEMANYVKRLDPQHLVTIGEEGFFGQERPEASHNPQVRTVLQDPGA